MAKASAVRVKKHGSQPAPLLNAVVAFGDTVQFLMPEPTEDPYQADKRRRQASPRKANRRA